MPKRIFLVPFLLGALAPYASAGSFSTIYSFGDSLSDAGNVKAVLGIPQAPYVDGHFTNGQIWLQDLAAGLGAGSVSASFTGGNDYAVGSATSGTTPFHTASAADLPFQLAAFQLGHGTADPNALYTIWIGADDIRALIASNPTAPQVAAGLAAVVGNIDSAIGSLAGLGAKNFLVVTVPDLGKTPEAIATGPLGIAAASALSASLDLTLVNGVPGTIPSLAAIAASQSLNLSVLDSYSLIDGIVAQPGAFGFSNVTDPCLVGAVNYVGGTPCANPSQYLFWDEIHPTAAGHALLAEAALQTVVPEPAAYTMVGVGVLALCAVRRRARKANQN